MLTCGPDSINFDLIQEQVSLFVRSLPTATRGHNAAFYRHELPELIKQLIDSQVENQEYMYEAENESSNETESENSSEASPDPMSATAA